MIENIIYFLVGALIFTIIQYARIKNLRKQSRKRNEATKQWKFQAEQNSSYISELQREVDALKQILKYRNDTIDMMGEANNKHIDEKRELIEELESTRQELIKRTNAKNNKKAVQ